MKLVQIVFSPTGGTQKVADILTEKWTGAAARVDLADGGPAIPDISIGQEDIALIAVPSYGGRVPGLAARRLGKLRGNSARCILVCVYGNRAYEDTLVELKDIAWDSGFQTAAAVSAVAEHSIMRQYATGRPDEKDIEELQGFAETIFEKLAAGKLTASAPELPGNRPYKKAGGAGLVPKADKKCIGCGLCAKSCPAQAIDPKSLKTADGKKCISCMRCVVKCPESARKVNSAMVSAAALALKKACSERKGNELFL